MTEKLSGVQFVVEDSGGVNDVKRGVENGANASPWTIATLGRSARLASALNTAQLRCLPSTHPPEDETSSAKRPIAHLTVAAHLFPRLNTAIYRASRRLSQSSTPLNL